MINYTIRSLEGYTDKIGDLVSMLEHTRAVTLSEVAHFSQWELDHVSDQEANSIGALLLYIASIEAVYQVISFENRDFNEEEQLKWGAALQLGESASRILKKQLQNKV
ncbi:hypothetical protein [Bacillus sp. FJAT-42315]|uniref:hypothetical protein n=1 Tax=Bacillus sp. FJAT-42315 TaxID=2014077 RepID=UPI000C24184B